MDTMAQLANVPLALEPQSAQGTEYAKRFRNLLTWITTTSTLSGTKIPRWVAIAMTDIPALIAQSAFVNTESILFT